MSAPVFLIGAGASVDAGMPLVTTLTEELRERLPHVRDMNGCTRADFGALFDAIANHDDEVTKNYERFFEWLAIIRQAQMTPFNKLTCFALDQQLLTAALELAFVINKPVWEILRSRHQLPTYQPGYFAKLRDFLPAHGRLKVFTTNYDLCVEHACRDQGVDIVTGFHPRTGRWTPSLFRNPGPGINLYKLHGSLNWNLGEHGVDWENSPLVERCRPQWDQVPELILGPGSKLQHDEPFVTLYAELHRAIRRARVCVAIGHSFRDLHIKEPICGANRRGMTVVDINPSCNDLAQKHYKKLRMGAKEALENGKILSVIKSY